jgi:hypothetical protein
MRSRKAAVQRFVHSSRPVVISYAATTSSSARCSIVNARVPSVTNEAYPPPTGCFQAGVRPVSGQSRSTLRSR